TTGSTACAYYNAHNKYPIMLNPSGQTQVGHVVRVKVPSTGIILNPEAEGPVLASGTAEQGQLFFATHAKRGHYRVFVPDSTGGWIRAADVDEVLTGTVIQTLPDPGAAYSYPGSLAVPYPLYMSPGSN